RDYTNGEIQHLDESLRHLLQIIQMEGPFVGIVGFSTGSTMALILMSLAERGASAQLLRDCNLDPHLLPQFPFQFGLCFSGCILSHPRYKEIFFPKIVTPILHFIGDYDTYLPRLEMLKFSRRCKNSVTVYHPGGHFVPRSRPCREAIRAFVTEQMRKHMHRS
ncbi:uncharacterized protein LY89DRAFT_601032, partial [Mollisia scopiformis]